MASRPLDIGIDGRELLGRPTGVGRYLRSVLEVWAAADTPHRLRVFLPAPLTRSLEDFGDRFTWRVVPSTRAGTWWEQRHLARAVARERPDVFFAPGYTAPLRAGCPTVVAVHDVSFFAHPEWFTWREGIRRRWLTRAAARRARAVITLTAFSTDEIVRWLGVARDRIRVAPPGAPAVRPLAVAAQRPPVVLYVGSLFGRRHIPVLIQAFAHVARRVPDARLVLVGEDRASPPIDPRRLAADAGLGDRVRWHPYVSDDELDTLYRSARAFAFLSEYEGFAMTPLEAIAHGLPPVLLETAVAREVYGDAASLVPADPAAVADALTVLLTDETARQALRAAGIARLERYAWSRTAATILAVLEEAAA